MPLPRTALRDVIQHCAGYPTTWGDQPLGYQKGVRVILSSTSSVEVGWDETKEEYDATRDARTVTSVSRRLYRMTARVDSFDPGVYPLDVGENIRTRLYRETSNADLAAAGATYLGSESLVATDWLIDGRMASSAILGLKFYVLGLDAQTDNAGGVINTFDVSGTPTP